MRYCTKAVALLLVVLLVSSAFIGCSADEMSIYKAMIKSQDITSMEAKTDLSFKIDVSGLPEEDAQAAQQLLATLNNLKLTLNQKSVLDNDKGLAKAQIDGNINMGGISMDLGIWVDSDMSNGNSSFKEIIKLPAMATAFMPPQFAGKEYIVIDPTKLTSQVPGADFNFDNMTKISKDLQASALDFFTKYSQNFKPGFNFIKYKGSSNSISSYELKLDDASFKALVKYIINDFAQNESTRNLVKDFLLTYLDSMSSISPIYADAKQGIETGFAEMESSLPEFQEKFNKFMEEFKNVKIIGDDGILIRYSVNSEGYIVKESGTINFVIDPKAIAEAFSKVDANTSASTASPDVSSTAAGIVKIGIDYNTDVISINKPLDIKIPELNSENSVDYFEMLNALITAPQPEFPGNQASGVTVYVNGQQVAFDDAPVVENGRVLVPAREIFEALNGVVTWDEETQTVTSEVDGSVITFKIGSSAASVNETENTLDVPAKLVNGRAFVPLRFIAESLNADIFWDEITSSAFIMK